MAHESRSISANRLPLEIDPLAVVCACFYYPRIGDVFFESKHFNPHDALKAHQPEFWPVVRKHKPEIPVHLIMAFRETDVIDNVDGLMGALNGLGCFEGHSIATGTMKVGIEKVGAGVVTSLEFYVGYCWKSAMPEIIYLGLNRIVPKKTKPSWKLW